MATAGYRGCPGPPHYNQFRSSKIWFGATILLSLCPHFVSSLRISTTTQWKLIAPAHVCVSSPLVKSISHIKPIKPKANRVFMDKAPGDRDKSVRQCFNVRPGQRSLDSLEGDDISAGAILRIPSSISCIYQTLLAFGEPLGMALRYDLVAEHQCEECLNVRSGQRSLGLLEQSVISSSLAIFRILSSISCIYQTLLAFGEPLGMTLRNDRAGERQRAFCEHPLTSVSPVTSSERLEPKPSHRPHSPLNASQICITAGQRTTGNAVEDNWRATATSLRAQLTSFPKPFQRSSLTQEKRAVAQLAAGAGRQTSMRCGERGQRGSNRKGVLGFTLGLRNDSRSNRTAGPQTPITLPGAHNYHRRQQQKLYYDDGDLLAAVQIGNPLARTYVADGHQKEDESAHQPNTPPHPPDFCAPDHLPCPTA